MEKTIEIPEGYEARIEDNKIILEPKESEDEKIKDRLINYFYGFLDGYENTYKVGGSVKWEGLDVKDVIAWLEKQGEQNPAWSGNDNVRLTSTIQVLEFAHSLDSYNQYGKKDIRDNLAWLKSLKDRVKPQPKSEWSEEDEKMLQGTIGSLRKYQLSIPSFRVELQMRWLSSLKNRI